MFQSWRDLLFAHWQVSRDELRPLVPRELTIEEHSGSAWLGLTPFCLTQLRAPWLPPVPRLSTFPEVNLRTYVRVGDKPGIYFFSLDAASKLTVLGARLLYRLPYFLARMRMEKSADGWLHYESRRLRGHADLNVRCRTVGQVFHPRGGTLEHFLTERYALYSVTRRGRVLRGDIHHDRWALQPAEAKISHNSVAPPAGVQLTGDPLLHFAPRQDTVVWPPVLVDISSW